MLLPKKYPQYLNVSTILYAPTIYFVKLSILLQYLRVFAPSRQIHLYLWVGIHLCIWNSLAFYLTDTIIAIVMRDPCEKLWDPKPNSPPCFDIQGSYRATGIFNVVSDFTILVLPMPCLYSLQMPLRRKLWIVAVFATGSL